jgi:hypothetical protein
MVWSLYTYEACGGPFIVVPPFDGRLVTCRTSTHLCHGYVERLIFARVCVVEAECTCVPERINMGSSNCVLFPRLAHDEIDRVSWEDG